MRTLILLLISCQAIAQQKATAIISFGRNTGPGTTLILHTADGPGVYLEFQSQIWQRAIDDDISGYNDPEEAKKLFDAIRQQNQSNATDVARQNLAFGISIPTKNPNLILGAGLGLQRQITQKRYSLGTDFQELSTYNAPKEETFYLASDNTTQWSAMVNGHAIFYSNRLAFKAGITFNESQAWGNLGLGIRF